jgi:asparagine synthase (glutamine-hydrolysing)
VAAHIGADHHEFVVRPDALSILPGIVWHMDEPLADSSVLPTWAVSEMARKHVTVVLSGDGGDETWAGYETYRTARLYSRADVLPLAFRRVVASLGASANGRWKSRLERLALDPVARHLEVMAIARAAEWRSLLAPDALRAVGELDPLAKLVPLAEGWRRNDPRALLQLDLTSYMTDDVLAKVDRMSMAQSLEVRVPLLDHVLVEFASRMPMDYKLRGGTSKALLKHAVRDLLPADVLARGKQGFAVPLRRWFGERFDGFVGDVLSEAAVLRRGLFDPYAVRTTIARAGGDPRAARRLWALLVFELWARAFLDRSVNAPGERPSLVSQETAVVGGRT